MRLIEDTSNWEWWRNVLAGEQVAFHENEPQPGFYKRRLAARGPFVPCRIFFKPVVDTDTGERLADDVLCCEINGRPSDPYAQWTYLAKHPIPEREYRKMIADQSGPEKGEEVTSLAPPPLPPMTFAHSAELGDLFKALSSFQAEVENPTRNRVVRVPNKFTFEYATFDSILAEGRPLWTDYGLVVTQFPITSEGKPALLTMLGHESGQWLRGTMNLPADQAGPQGLGSSISYVRRYAVCAILGIAAEFDEDGNVAEGTRAEFADKPTTPTIGAERRRIVAEIATAQTQEAVKEILTINKQILTRIHAKNPESHAAIIQAAVARETALRKAI